MNTPIAGDWFDPDATTFGDRVAGAREHAGMTQADLAQRLGIKEKTLKDWEDDLSEPRANKLSMMSGLLNVSLRWLLNGTGEGPNDPNEAGHLTHEMTSLLTEIHDIRAQLVRSGDRLVRLEKNLRALMKEEPRD